MRECVWSIGGMIATGSYEVTGKESVPVPLNATMNPVGFMVALSGTGTGLRRNVGPRREISTTDT
jgi:hypothetical protein